MQLFSKAMKELQTIIETFEQAGRDSIVPALARVILVGDSIRALS